MHASDHYPIFSWTPLLPKTASSLPLSLCSFLPFLFYEQSKYLMCLDGPPPVFRLFMQLIKNGLFHQNNATFRIRHYFDMIYNIFDETRVWVGICNICVFYEFLLQKNGAKCQTHGRFGLLFEHRMTVTRLISSKIRLCTRYFCACFVKKTLCVWAKNWFSGMSLCVRVRLFVEFNRFSVKIYTTCHILCHWITFRVARKWFFFFCCFSFVSPLPKY